MTDSTHAQHPTTLARRRGRSGWLLWAVIAAIFTTIVIQDSRVEGKLAVYPFYDDVGYFVDALNRLQQLYHGGVSAVGHGLVRLPPHSLFSTALALGSYVVFGVHDWAPYAGNGLIVLAFAGLVNLLSRGLPRWQRVAIFVFALTVPVSAKAVFEFRPDVASALCAAAGATFMVTRPLSESGWRHRVGCGGLFGLAMLFKPPTFPLTLAVLLSSLAIAVPQDRILLPRLPSARRLAVNAGQVFFTAILVPIPAYLFQFMEILHYIWDPIFGKGNEMWRTPGPWSWQVLYYLTGPAGSEMLGPYLYLLLGMIVLGALAAAILGKRDVFIRIVCLVAISAVSFAIPAAMSVKQEFFGATFDWLLVFAALFVLISVARHASRPIGWAVLILALASGLALARYLPKLYLPSAENATARRRIVEQLYGALRDRHAGSLRVFLTTTGFVNESVINYLALLDGQPQFNFSGVPFSDKLDDYRQQIAQADFVIASEQGNSEAYGGFIPSGNIQDQTLQLVRDSGAFEQVAAFRTNTPKRYFLFERIPPFHGWNILSGMGAVEGPYPQWRVPRVRWGYGPASVAMMDVKSAGRYQLIFDARAAVAKSTLIVRVDGAEIGRHLFQDARAFEGFEFPVDLKAGSHRIELSCSDWLHSDRPLAVLFKGAALEPGAPSESRR